MATMDKTCRFSDSECNPNSVTECDACADYYNENPEECDCGGPNCGENAIRIQALREALDRDERGATNAR